MTFAPLAARPRAMPRPMPLVEPVTMADFPDNMAITLRLRMKCQHEARWRGCRCLVRRNAQIASGGHDGGVRYFLQTCDSGRCVYAAASIVIPSVIAALNSATDRWSFFSWGIAMDARTTGLDSSTLQIPLQLRTGGPIAATGSRWCCRAAARSAPTRPVSIRRCRKAASSRIGCAEYRSARSIPRSSPAIHRSGVWKGCGSSGSASPAARSGTTRRMATSTARRVTSRARS